MPLTHLVWLGEALSDHTKLCVFCKGAIITGQQLGILGCVFPDRRHYVCHVACFDAAAADEPAAQPEPARKRPAINREAPSGIDTTDWK